MTKTWLFSASPRVEYYKPCNDPFRNRLAVFVHAQPFQPYNSDRPEPKRVKHSPANIRLSLERPTRNIDKLRTKVLFVLPLGGLRVRARGHDKE
jgi:hypothetical protein